MPAAAQVNTRLSPGFTQANDAGNAVPSNGDPNANSNPNQQSTDLSPNFTLQTSHAPNPSNVATAISGPLSNPGPMNDPTASPSATRARPSGIATAISSSIPGSQPSGSGIQESRLSIETASPSAMPTSAPALASVTDMSPGLTLSHSGAVMASAGSATMGSLATSMTTGASPTLSGMSAGSTMGTSPSSNPSSSALTAANAAASSTAPSSGPTGAAMPMITMNSSLAALVLMICVWMGIA